MFRAEIRRGEYIYNGTVYQIFPQDLGILYAVYRLDWEGEWRVCPLEDVNPIDDVEV